MKYEGMTKTIQDGSHLWKEGGQYEREGAGRELSL